MPFTPEFMLHMDQFHRERDAVRSLDDWKAFYKKWLDNRSWPIKAPEVRRTEEMRKRGPVSIGGRRWGFTYWNYDISPEARYEYCVAFNVGRPFKFPDEKDAAKIAENGFYQECPYCEISTRQIGANICPQCGRKLILERSAD